MVQRLTLVEPTVDFRSFHFAIYILLKNQLAITLAALIIYLLPEFEFIYQYIVTY